MLDKTVNSKEHRYRVLVEFGKESGRLALTRGRGRGRGGAKGVGDRHVRVPMATVPTTEVMTGGAKVDKTTGGQTGRSMTGQMTLKDEEICKRKNLQVA